MDTAFRDRFVRLWTQHFDGAELPIGFYYSDDEAHGRLVQPTRGHTCLIDQLSGVRDGQTLCVDRDSLGCPGARKYLGFTRETMPHFEEFLSCGIPGKLEGERYKKSPQIVREAMERQPPFEAPARYAVFKRWDRLEAADEPAVVIFFAAADVLAGLFTLSNFDETDPNAVIAPFGAGCATIGQYPYLEAGSKRPRSILGMFDVSARPFVPRAALSFATPVAKFARMVENMDESFLVTGSWAKVWERIKPLGR